MVSNTASDYSFTQGTQEVEMINNCISQGRGSDYVVIESATGRICTNTVVFELMQYKEALEPVEGFCDGLEPSEEKTELQALLNLVKRHWKEVENV